MEAQEVLNQNFDSILFFSIIISFITFFFWSRPGTQFLSYLSGQRNGSNTTTTSNNRNNPSNTDFSVEHSNNTSNNSNSNIQTTTTTSETTATATDNDTPIIQPIERPTEPYQENFTSDIDDLVKINIIQSETVYHRTFRQSKILKVYDLKKYFYPKEIQDNKRILFIYNGRAMIDNHFLSTHPNLLNGVNGPGFVHCLIKNPLTADQVDNNGSGGGGGGYYSNSYGFGSGNGNGRVGGNTNNYVGGNIDGRGYTQNGYNNNDFFTWMCTKTLFGLTGLFLGLLWCLQFTNPKLFNLFSSVMLFVFTIFWGFGFYSSLKPNLIYQQQSQQQQSQQQSQQQQHPQQPQQSQQQPNTHLHND
ncbi:hypothetical protein ACTFIU_005046 [Dictyostelium citrinum]